MEEKLTLSNQAKLHRKSIGDQLVTRRLAKGWSRDELADRAVLSVNTLRSIELGLVGAQLRTLETVDELLT